MKRGLHSFLLVICTLALSAVFSCAQDSPQMELTTHMEKIISILKENQDDANLASASLKEYVDGNLAAIKNIIIKIEEYNANKKEKDKPVISLIFRHEQIIKELKTLEQEKPNLMKDEKVKEALKPLFEALKISI